eukprot:CAMPEP_0184863608 /NCGR_PEP_ID=MMETSP0580-20130426/11869_1 /TAXON_ID=1118495 /ORGANISM="Dactyliosolen fragilissimus" /LENGTH=193 /DNA_ID=CAMNT_0027362047 /DNA_START=110 /DNA_END=691 /DNA_ORIENTATION=-
MSTWGDPYKKDPRRMEFCAVAIQTITNENNDFGDGDYTEKQHIPRFEERVIGLAPLVDNKMAREYFSSLLHKDIHDGEFYLEEMCVLPEFRGQGIGTEILRWCDRMVMKEGGSYLTLGVVNGNPARNLYERHGFVETSSDCLFVYCLLGRPYGRCGGVMMEKVFEIEDQNDKPTYPSGEIMIENLEISVMERD